MKIDKYYLRFWLIVGVILLALVTVFSSCAEWEAKSTCAEVVRIQHGYFEVHFPIGDNLHSEWFVSDRADTLKVGQKVCLR